MNNAASLLQTVAEWLPQQPWLILLLAVLPLVAAAVYARTMPHLPLVVLLAVPTLLSVGVLLRNDVVLFVTAIDLAVVAAAVIDFLTLPRQKAFSAERQTGRIASLAKNHRVELTVNNHSGRQHVVWVRDDVPQHCTAAPEEFCLNLTGHSRSLIHYELQASRRGTVRWQQVYLRVRSRLGLWQRYFTYDLPSVAYVYPDMQQLSEYALLARTNRLSLLGVRRTRKVGQDHEFERLRDYTRDDNYKHIDWRATARRRRLTVKDFQASQSQRILFLVDCGRMMTNQAAGLSLLDHSLNAMLMLSHVALKQGDSVGLICFSDRVHAYVPPTGGMNQMNRLLHSAFDRFPRLVESRYDQAFLYLSSHCRKRALVVLISNVIDDVNAHQIKQYLSTLVGRHLPLGVLLRDHRLFDAADGSALGDKELYRSAAAAQILTWRHQVLTDLVHQGVLALDVFPEQMTAPLINQYLEIKARHLL